MNNTEKLKLITSAARGLIGALKDNWHGGADNALEQARWLSMLESTLALALPGELTEAIEAVAQLDDKKWTLPHGLHWEWKPEYVYKWSIWDTANHGLWLNRCPRVVQGWLPSEHDKDTPMLVNLLRERNGIVTKG